MTKILVTLLSLSFLSCSQLTSRQPSAVHSSQPASYTYKPTLQCEVRSEMSAFEEQSARWSPLSGYPVGPNQNKLYQSASDKILKPFTSDGCSSSPDGRVGADESKKWAACCVAHDSVYWLGGTKEEKLESDEQLEICIAKKGYPRIGRIYKTFVNKFGRPDSSQSFRWGYGWNYQRPYGPITAEEENKVQVLYGESSQATKNRLAMTFSSLTEPCDTYDTTLQKVSRDEQIIYTYLNSQLKQDTVIESIRLSDMNLVEKTYLVKLENCKTPVGIVLALKTKEIRHVRISCEGI